MFVLQALMMGEPFFDCQVGVVGCRAVCLKGIMGIRDFEENMNRKEEVIDTHTHSLTAPSSSCGDVECVFAAAGCRVLPLRRHAERQGHDVPDQLALRLPQPREQRRPCGIHTGWKPSQGTSVV